MQQPKESTGRPSLLIVIFLMFLLTWPVMLAEAGTLPFEPPLAVSLFIGWGVSAAALIMTAWTHGKAGVVGLIRRFLVWRVSWKWYVVALLLFPAIAFLSVLISAALSGKPVDFGTAAAYEIFGSGATLSSVVLPFFLFDMISNGEELGWRGYVLPRLQARYSALVSSLIVGVIWALWHLPKFMAPGNTNPFGLFAVKLIVESVLYTWLYNSTRGSLLLVTMFHAAGNTAGVFLPVAITTAGFNSGGMVIQLMLEIVVVVVVVVTHGHERLSNISSPSSV